MLKGNRENQETILNNRSGYFERPVCQCRKNSHPQARPHQIEKAEMNFKAL